MKPNMQEVLILKKKKTSVAGQFAGVKYRPETYCWTQKLNREDYGVDKEGSSINVTDVPRVLQMLEASRNASRFADTIEYAMFAQASGIT